MKRVSLVVNGTNSVVDIEPRMHLADLLREQFLLTGTHLGCEHGVCGACTVEIDGVPARSCITLAVACDGAKIQTIEGFDDDPLMTKMREAFTREHALQCGFCTPGMLIAARDLVKRLPKADASLIRREMEGNLCRCTGYMGIVRAIASVTYDPAPEINGTGEIKEEKTKYNKSIGYVFEVTLPSDATQLAESFSVTRSPDRVWSLLQDFERVAACMPGAQLTKFDPEGQLEGQINLALGPIRAVFSGRATVHFDEDQQSGKVIATGRDSITSSGVICEAAFLLKKNNGGTTVDINIRYSLSGSLVQFGRSELAIGVAKELTKTLAKNLESELMGQYIPEGEGRIGLLSFVFKTFKKRLMRLFGKYKEYNNVTHRR